jgi:hypothetical protein
MTPINKVYYQRAAAEAAAGHVDQALWIKIRADNPDVDDTSLHVRYIRARAEELAAEGLKTSVATAVKKGRSFLKDAILIALFLGGLLVFILYSNAKEQVQRDSHALFDAIQALNKAADDNDQYFYGKALDSIDKACHDLNVSTDDAFGNFADSRSDVDKKIADKRCIGEAEIRSARTFQQLDNEDLDHRAEALETGHPESMAGQHLRFEKRDLPMPQLQ